MAASVAYRSPPLAPLMEAAPCAIVATDLRGVVREFNPAASALFGYRPEEVRGRPVRMLMTEGQRARHAEIMREPHDWTPGVLARGQVVPVRTRSGAERQVRATIVRAGDGRRRRLLALMEAVETEAPPVAEALAAALAQDLKPTLAEAAARLEASDRRLARSGLGEADQARRDLQAALARIRWADVVADAVTRAAAPVADARAQRDLSRLVCDAALTLREQGETCALTLDLAPGPLPVHIDPAQIRLALLDLVRKAADAVRSRPGARVTLTTRRAAAWAEALVSGEGGPEPGGRAALAALERAGRGRTIGVARWMAEANDGELLDSEGPEGGPRLALRLPLA